MTSTLYSPSVGDKIVNILDVNTSLPSPEPPLGASVFTKYFASGISSQVISVDGSYPDFRPSESVISSRTGE